MLQYRHCKCCSAVSHISSTWCSPSFSKFLKIFTFVLTETDLLPWTEQLRYKTPLYQMHSVILITPKNLPFVFPQDRGRQLCFVVNRFSSLSKCQGLNLQNMVQCKATLSPNASDVHYV